MIRCISGWLIAAVLSLVAISQAAAEVTLTTSLADWQQAAASYVNSTSNYGATSTSLGGGSVDYPASNVVTVGESWNTWCCGYTGEAIWPGQGISTVTINLKGVSAFGMQVEPDPYEVDSMTITLSNGQTITADVGGEAGAQFFGFVGAGVTSITITDNAGEDFAFGNFYSVGKSCPASDAQGVETSQAAAGGCVTISGADLVSDVVTVNLHGAAGDKGKLTVTAIGSNGQYVTTVKDGNPVGSGSYNVKIDRPKMPIDLYSSLQANWALDSGVTSASYTLPQPWNVLGTIHHTQYNTPLETMCSGTDTTAFIVDSSCTFTQTTLKSDFVHQTKLNGTGSSASFGLIKPAAITIEPTLCSGVKKPKGATKANTYYQVSTVTGDCNTTLTPNLSVATFPDPNAAAAPDAVCGDNMLLSTAANVNKAVKSVGDLCPRCSTAFAGTNGHIDNYAPSQACTANDVGDLGKFWTANTHGENQ